ncbi:MAG: ABC transporter permease [Muribaculaceae bacterium]|nr:ABC transporter permease [Muribaculaceae bacterium]
MKNPIFDMENWREIGATLARNKTRTFLTAFGIFWGTAMLAMLWGGAHGLEGTLRRNFSGFSTNLGAIFPGETSVPYKGFNKGMHWSMTQNDVDVIRRITPDLEYSTTICQNYGTINYGTKSTSAQITGYEPDFSKILIPVVYSGRVFNSSDEAGSRKVALIGKNLAEKLFGTEDPIGKFVSAQGVYFMVVGVIGQTSMASIGGRYDDSLLIPSSTFRRAYNWGNQVNFFMYTVSPGLSPSDLKTQIRRAICMNHPISPDDDKAMWFMDISEEFKMIDNLFLGVSLLALFVGAGSLMAGIIGIGNIMWIIVKERTQEIGIRRAIGAKPRDIIVQILSEGVVLTSIAGLAGVCFATLVLAVVDSQTADPVLGSAGFTLTFSQAIGIVLTFLVLGTAAGTLPAIKAMRIKPIEAMRDK